MTTNLIKPSRIDFDKVDINQIQRILSTGTLKPSRPMKGNITALWKWYGDFVPVCV